MKIDEKTRREIAEKIVDKISSRVFNMINPYGINSDIKTLRRAIIAYFTHVAVKDTEKAIMVHDERGPSSLDIC